MDLTCFNWIQLVKKSDLPPNAKYLAFYLSTFMNAEHDIAWPSQTRVSNETGLSKPTVIKYLHYLAEQQWLIIRQNVHHVNTGQQNYLHNEYIISIPEQELNRLTADMSRGKKYREQGLNSEGPGVKQLNPNNNMNNNYNNNKDMGDYSSPVTQGKPISKFVPPAIEEVEQYCAENGYQINPGSFVDFYQSKGWMVGKNKMKDWKAAVRTWERKNAKNRGVGKPSLAEQATRARIEYERASASQVSPGIYQVDVKLVGADDTPIRVQLDND